MSLVAYGNSSGEESDEYDSTDEKEETKPSTSSSAASVPITSLEPKPSTSSTLALKLPSPKKHHASNTIIEEDDEFLHKKAVSTLEPPPKPVKRNIVQITIPALQKIDEPTKLNKKIIGAQPNRPAGLLNLLPKPTFGNFTKKSSIDIGNASSSMATKSKPANGFIPHSVTKSAASAKKPIQKLPTKDDGNSDSNSDSDNDDFFAFHSETKLPEVSQQEINAMVAKKTADMKTATSTYLQSMERQPVDVDADQVEDVPEQSQIDEEALTALCGAKRARRGDASSVVIDIYGDQVLPNREEWLRNQLQSTTEYQPRGLVDEEPAVGTKKKHQITYLAHQAKANEQELQAMWAANRHTRRQTQNKYGF